MPYLPQFVTLSFWTNTEGPWGGNVPHDHPTMYSHFQGVLKRIVCDEAGGASMLSGEGCRGPGEALNGVGLRRSSLAPLAARQGSQAMGTAWSDPERSTTRQDKPLCLLSPRACRLGVGLNRRHALQYNDLGSRAACFLCRRADIGQGCGLPPTSTACQERQEAASPPAPALASLAQPAASTVSCEELAGCLVALHGSSQLAIASQVSGTTITPLLLSRRRSPPPARRRKPPPPSTPPPMPPPPSPYVATKVSGTLRAITGPAWLTHSFAPNTA
jgi:hypothetical protein